MIFKTICSEKVPVLGIGTSGMGGKNKPDYSRDKFHVKTIKKSLSLGLTHIDTAEIYGEGHTEEIVGKAIKGFDRKKLFITTKVWRTNLSYRNVIRSVENSLMRIQTPYIDLYLIHFPNPDIPLRETVKALNELLKNGIVRFLGVSNFPFFMIEKIQKISKNKIFAIQEVYNLIKRPDPRILDYVQKNEMTLISASPLAGGKLSKPIYKELVYLSKIYNKSYSQIALNWLLSKPNVITIPKSNNINHILENKSSIGWKIDNKHISILDTKVNSNKLNIIFNFSDRIKSKNIFKNITDIIR